MHTKRGITSQLRVFAPHGFAPSFQTTYGKQPYPDAVLLGSTPHFNVFVDPSVRYGGAQIAQGVLATCERDFTRLSGWFTNAGPPTVNIIVASGISGAFHNDCTDADLFCDGIGMPTPNPAFTSFLAVAELVEVFEAIQDQGWDCTANNGEGLSRVLATEIYPDQLLTVPGLSTAAYWLSSNRPDWVNNTNSTDRDSVSNGCAVLFLNYLHYQLGYSWNAIVAAAGSTLGDTYRRLIATADDPFPAFSALLASRFPIGQPVSLQTDNPFPIL